MVEKHCFKGIHIQGLTLCNLLPFSIPSHFAKEHPSAPSHICAAVLLWELKPGRGENKEILVLAGTEKVNNTDQVSNKSFFRFEGFFALNQIEGGYNSLACFELFF